MTTSRPAMSFLQKDHSRIARSRIAERCEHLSSSLLDISKTIRQRFLVSVPELDIVGCGRTGFEPDGMANDEGGSFGFCLTDFARRLFAAIATVQKLALWKRELQCLVEKCGIDV